MAFRQHSLSFSGFSPMTRPARDTWSICDGQTASPARNAGISASPIGLLNVHRLSCGVALVTPMCRPMAATVMKSSHAPLSVWFWGAYLVTAQTPGQPALQFQRQLGLSRYEAAFQMLHKLRAGLVRPGRDAIGDQYPVEVDETLVGGRTKGEGRGVHYKATVAGAVEVRTRPPAAEGKKHKRTIYAGRLRLRLVPGRGANEPREFVQENVVKGAVVRTDGWKGYDDLALWATRTNPWRLMETPKEPMLTFRWPTSPSRTSRHGCLERITGSVIIACRLISTNLCFGSIGASTR